MMNTLKRELYKQQDQLLVDHQQEDLVDGGDAASIQFHYLLVPNTTAMTSTSTPAAVFDANQGEVGTAEYVFETRRDFDYNARGF